MSRHWVDHEHKDVQRLAERWRFVDDMYTGEFAAQEKVTKYLLRKAQNESTENYAERCRLADPVSHFSTIVDGFAGMLMKSEQNATRIFNRDEKEGGEILGNPADRESVIGQLYSDADGTGTGYLSVWQQFHSRLIALHKQWVLADSFDGAPILRLLDPWAVSNWWTNPETGAIETVVVREEADARTSIEDEPLCKDAWIRYDLNGWSRWEKSRDGKDLLMVDDGTYRFLDQRKRRILPIFPVELRLKRHAGWIIARRIYTYFNKKSDRDNLVRTCNHPRLVLVGSNQHVENVVDKVQNQGWNVLHQLPEYGTSHGYIAPSSEPASVATEILDKDLRDIYVSAFREYGDAAAQTNTATEIEQRMASGVEAFLNQCVQAADAAENGFLLRATQIVYPDARRRGMWFLPHVERSTDHVPKDADAVLDKTIERAFGTAERSPIPMGLTAKLAAAKQIAEHEGLETNEAEMRSALQLETVLKVLESATTAGIPLPAVVRVELGMQLLAAAGYLDPEAVIDLADGQKGKLLAVVRKLMEEQAQAADEAQRLAAQGLPREPVDDGDEDEPPRSGGAAA